MKAKYKYVIIPILLLAVITTACSRNVEELATETSKTDERIFVEELGYDELMGSFIADVNNLEAITELSSHAVLCHVDAMTDVKATDLGFFNFRYEVTVSDIFMDTTDTIDIGDVITISASEGILKASEAAEMIGDSPRSKKLGILQGEYGENEYIRSSTYNAVPIEVGKSYIMFLTDDYLEKDGVYAEIGRSFLWEYTNDTIYTERIFTRSEDTYDDIVRMIEEQISKRTGRADEIGASGYMHELGERQAAERAAIEDTAVE